MKKRVRRSLTQPKYLSAEPVPTPAIKKAAIQISAAEIFSDVELIVGLTALSDGKEPVRIFAATSAAPMPPKKLRYIACPA